MRISLLAAKELPDGSEELPVIDGPDGAKVLRKVTISSLVAAGLAPLLTAATNALDGLVAAAAGSATAAADSAASAGSSATSGNIALAALAGFVDADVTIGTLPVAGTQWSPLGALGYTGVVASKTARLQSFSVWVHSVGDGSMILGYTFPYTGGTFNACMGKVAITGITGTGLHTFTAGTHFPDDLLVLEGSEFAVGSLNGGVTLDAEVNMGGGKSYPANGGGYNVAKAAMNYIPRLQVTLTAKKRVAHEIALAGKLAAQIAVDGYVTDYAGPDDLIFGDGLAGGAFAPNPVYPVGGNAPTPNDGLWAGVEYTATAATAGDVFFLAFDPVSFKCIEYFRATLANVVKGFAAYPVTADKGLPWLPAGTIIVQQPITGTCAVKGYNRQPSYFPSIGYLLSGAVFDHSGAAYNRIPCLRAVIQRPRYARETAHAATSGATLTLRQSFQGNVLPTGGNPGQWTAGDLAFTCNNGLISPSAPAAGYGHNYIYNNPSTAHRRTVSAKIVMGDAANIGGLIFISQQGSTSKMGTLVQIDGPAAKGRVYRMNGGTGVPVDAGLSVDLPWVPDAADIVIVTARRRRNRFTFTFTLINRPGLASNSCSIGYSASGVGIHGGWMSGQLGAHFHSGPGGMVWKYIEARTGWKKGAGAKLIFDDSTGDSAFIGGQGDYSRAWWDIVEDRRGKGDMLNCSKSSTDTGAALKVLSEDFTALVGSGATDGIGVEVFWCLGVNPRHGGAETDAQWYANYKADTLAAKAIVEGTGAKFTVVTPNPANYITSYVHLLVSNILAGDLGDVDLIDINAPLATSNANRGSWGATITSIDTLHPDQIFTTPQIADNIFAQRPDLAWAA